MKTDRARARECDDKRRYVSQWAARVALTSVYDRNPALEGKLHIYICRFCGNWHMGHISKDRES